MTLQELKEAIIKDETEFIIEMHTDAGSTLAEVSFHFYLTYIQLIN